MPCITAISAGKLSMMSAADRSSPMKRSEEHTSELQSLMRIPYAAFCLKKKKHKLFNRRYIGPTIIERSTVQECTLSHDSQAEDATSSRNHKYTQHPSDNT